MEPRENTADKSFVIASTNETNAPARSLHQSRASTDSLYILNDLTHWLQDYEQGSLKEAG